MRIQIPGTAPSPRPALKPVPIPVEAEPILRALEQGKTAQVKPMPPVRRTR
jgi:hypothetical protein